MENITRAKTFSKKLFRPSDSLGPDLCTKYVECPVSFSRNVFARFTEASPLLLWSKVICRYYCFTTTTKKKTSNA